MITRGVRGFARLRGAQRAWLLPIWLLLGISRFAVLTVPFRWLAPRLGTAAGTHSCVPLIGGSDQEHARWIGMLVRFAARYTPWQSNCLAQAISARVLLGLHGVPYSLFLGVFQEVGAAGTNRSELKAHAWVSAGKLAVTGGNGFSRFAVVGCYFDLRPGADCQETIKARR